MAKRKKTTERSYLDDPGYVTQAQHVLSMSPPPSPKPAPRLPTDCPNLLAFVTSPDFITGVNRKAYAIAQRFRPVEWRDLAEEVQSEIWKDGTRHRYERFWTTKGAEDARRIINHAVDADARRLAFEMRARRRPLAPGQGLGLAELSYALGWDGGWPAYDTDNVDPDPSRRRDHPTRDVLFPEAAVGLIKSWSPDRQALFRMAWVERRHWSAIAAELGGTESAVRRRGARLRRYALNAR